MICGDIESKDDYVHFNSDDGELTEETIEFLMEQYGITDREEFMKIYEEQADMD